jgi:hypothetical protein
MSSHASAPSTATPRQLAYLRSLALAIGTTFSLPRSRRQASCEIERIKELKASRGTHREAPQDTDPAEEPYATAVHSSEVSGFGANCQWSSSPPVAVPAPTKCRVGELTELARYEVSGGERVLYGQRINGCVRVTDRPSCGPGRSYLVERELERDGLDALNALVADYLEQASELDEVPMAPAGQLDQLGGNA